MLWVAAASRLMLAALQGQQLQEGAVQVLVGGALQQGRGLPLRSRAPVRCLTTCGLIQADASHRP